jgi:hypothetical protein
MRDPYENCGKIVFTMWKFAFAGWAIATGIFLLVTLVRAFIPGNSGVLSSGGSAWFLFDLVCFGFLGIVGGGLIGLEVAVWVHFVKRPVKKPISRTENDPAISPPPPELPE